MARRVLYPGCDGARKTGPSTDIETPKDTTMLVLSRKLGEKIVIGDNIVLTVVKIDRNQVRLGIEAPGDVPVFREEILPGRVASAEDAILSR